MKASTFVAALLFAVPVVAQQQQTGHILSFTLPLDRGGVWGIAWLVARWHQRTDGRRSDW
jgi:hypothetical protein